MPIVGRFRKALFAEDWNNAGLHLRNMKATEAREHIPLLFEFLKQHLRDQLSASEHSRKHVIQTKKQTAPKPEELKPDNAPVNLIHSTVWNVMLKQLDKSGQRYNDEGAVPVLEVLEYASRTRHLDVMPAILPVVERMRKGEFYSKDGKINANVALCLLGILQHLNAHTEKLSHHQVGRVQQLIQHVKNEIEQGRLERFTYR